MLGPVLFNLAMTVLVILAVIVVVYIGIRLLPVGARVGRHFGDTTRRSMRESRRILSDNNEEER